MIFLSHGVIKKQKSAGKILGLVLAESVIELETSAGPINSGDIVIDSTIEGAPHVNCTNYLGAGDGLHLTIENGFILSYEWSVESEFDSSKSVELGSSSRHSSKSKFGDFGGEHPNITILSVSIFFFFFFF